MSPLVLHRYRIPFAEIVAAMTSERAVSAVVARIDGDSVVLDIEQAPQAAPAAASSAEQAKGGPIARRAALLCTQGGFLAFLGVASEADAADIIRRDCGIGSRAELDHSAAAADRFRDIEARYDLWLKGYD